jgi:hypothetical protein
MAELVPLINEEENMLHMLHPTYCIGTYVKPLDAVQQIAMLSDRICAVLHPLALKTIVQNKFLIKKKLNNNSRYITIAVRQGVWR